MYDNRKVAAREEREELEERVRTTEYKLRVEICKKEGANRKLNEVAQATNELRQTREVLAEDEKNLCF